MNIIRVNQAMRELYPGSIPLEGKKCHLAYAGLSKPCTACPTLRTFESGKLEWEEIPLQKDGQITGTLEVFTFPILDGQGVPSGVVEYVRDITERKEMRAQIEARNRMLEISNRELDDFAYIASHDLREPLRGIANYSRFLQDDNYLLCS